MLTPKRVRFVYGEQYIEDEDKSKTSMREIVLMTAEWDTSKYSLKPKSLY